MVDCFQEEKQRTMEEQGNGANPEEELLQRAAAELAQVQARIGPRFRRAEARLRAGRFLQALLAPVERKNGGSYTALVKERVLALAPIEEW